MLPFFLSPSSSTPPPKCQFCSGFSGLTVSTAPWPLGPATRRCGDPRLNPVKPTELPSTTRRRSSSSWLHHPVPMRMPTSLPYLLRTPMPDTLSLLPTSPQPTQSVPVLYTVPQLVSLKGHWWLSGHSYIWSHIAIIMVSFYAFYRMRH